MSSTQHKITKVAPEIKESRDEELLKNVPDTKVQEEDLKKLLPNKSKKSLKVEKLIWTPDLTYLSDNDDVDNLDIEPGYFPPDSESTESDSESEIEDLCRNYAFRHSDCANEPTDDGSNPYLNELGLQTMILTKDQIAKSLGRKICRRQIYLEYYRDIKDIREVKGSFLRCPQGGNYCCDTYKRRKEPDTFNVCSVPHLHGDVFQAFRCKTRFYEIPTWRRPPHFNINRRRTGPIWRKHNIPPLRECIQCQHYTFHHRDSGKEIYDDYVDKIQYQGINPDSLPIDEQLSDYAKRIADGKKKRRRRKYFSPMKTEQSEVAISSTARRIAEAKQKEIERKRKLKKKVQITQQAQRIKDKATMEMFKHIESKVDTAGPQSFVTRKGLIMNPKIKPKPKQSLLELIQSTHDKEILAAVTTKYIMDEKGSVSSIVYPRPLKKNPPKLNKYTPQ